jgi:hypothetical protein
MNAPLYTIGPWLSWRWTEQWLPHSTWFLTALAARYDEVRVLLPTGVERRSRGLAARPQVRLEGSVLAIELLEPTGSALTIDVADARGRHVAHGALPAGESRAQIKLEASAQGVLLVRVGENLMRLVR